MINFTGGFSVLMALYHGDNPDLFLKSIDSVYSNSLLPNSTLLIVDGEISTKLSDSLEIAIAKYCSIGLEVFRLDENAGLALALNYGLQKISTRWVVRADSDDINLNDRFYSMAKFHMDNPNIKVFGGLIREVDGLGSGNYIRSVPLSCNEIHKQCKSRNPFNHMSVAYERDLILSVGSYPNIFLREDYGLWCLLVSKNIQMANMNQILVLATVNQNFYKRRGGLKYAIGEIALERYKRQIGFSKDKLSISFYIRFVFFILPSSLREFFYRKFLRVY